MFKETPEEINPNIIIPTKKMSLKEFKKEYCNSEVGEEKLISDYVFDFEEKFGTLGSYNENIKSFLEKSLQSVYKQGGLDNEVGWIKNEKNWCGIVKKEKQEAYEKGREDAFIFKDKTLIIGDMDGFTNEIKQEARESLKKELIKWAEEELKSPGTTTSEWGFGYEKALSDLISKLNQ